MKQPVREPLSEEEARWAVRLAQLPNAEPGATLDDRIRHQARAALRRSPLPWWGGALAAVLALGVGVRVLLAPVGIEANRQSERPTPAQPAPAAGTVMATETESEMDSVTVSGSRIRAVQPADEGVGADSSNPAPTSRESQTGAPPTIVAGDRIQSQPALPPTAPPAREGADRALRPQAFPAAAPPAPAVIPDQHQRKALPTAAPAPPANPPAPPAAAAGPVGALRDARPAARPEPDRARAAQAATAETAPAIEQAEERDEATFDRAEVPTPVAAKRSDRAFDDRSPAGPAEPLGPSRSAQEVGSRAAGETSSMRQADLPLAELIRLARHWHARGDARALGEVLRRIEREYPAAALPEDVRRWLAAERARP